MSVSCGTTTDAPMSAPSRPWSVRDRARHHAAPRAQMPPLTRRYDVAQLTPEGAIDERARPGPAIPPFEEAFTALARGAVIATQDGPVAVEDLLPGTLVQTERGPMPLLWKGSVVLPPSASLRLYRIPADAFGLARPMGDLILGPGARILSRDPGLCAAVGAQGALIPVRAIADGISAIEITPPSAIELFQLGFAGAQIVPVAGFEVESLRCAPPAPGTLHPDLEALRAALFAHPALPGSGSGHKLPRLGEEEAVRLRAA